MRIKALGSLVWLALSPVQRQDLLLGELDLFELTAGQLVRIQSLKVKVIRFSLTRKAN